MLGWLRDRIPAEEVEEAETVGAEEPSGVETSARERESWQSSSTVQTVFWDAVDGDAAGGSTGQDETF